MQKRPSNRPRVASVFPYFGGKSKIAHLYAAPQEGIDLIIEPFSGGASYSLLHSSTPMGNGKPIKVWLNDLNPATYMVWKFLTSPDALDIVRTRIPLTVEPGMTIDDLGAPGDPEGLTWLMRSQFAQSAFGMKGVRTKVAPFGAHAWKSFRNRLETYIPRMTDWTVTNLPYQELPDVRACWYIDPPYNNKAGESYNCGAKGIDYAHLGAWCKSRKGQVMVCENAGADWLPFKMLTEKRIGIYSESITSTVGEVIYEQSDVVEDGVFG